MVLGLGREKREGRGLLEEEDAQQRQQQRLTWSEMSVLGHLLAWQGHGSFLFLASIDLQCY